MSSANSTIRPSQPRSTVQVHFSDGQILEGPLGTTIEAFTQAEAFNSTLTPLACLVNGVLRELTVVVNEDVNVQLLTLADPDGRRVYRRSLCLLLVAAAYELFPEAKIFIDYGLNFGALYCEVQGQPSFSRAELKQIEARMFELVEADLPIRRERVSMTAATSMLRGLDDKLRLLNTRRRPHVPIYTLGNYRDHFYGYMVPSTGYLGFFSLDPYSKGFVLRYPTSHNFTKLQPIVNYPMLVGVFDEYGDWMDKLGIRNAGALNSVISQGDLLETILVAEALQEQRIASITTLLASLHQPGRVVLIAGPSAAGKTTFSKRLAIQLLAHGIQPLTLGLDDFLVNRENTPRDEEDDYDFESLYALDLEFFNECLLRLMEGDMVTLPHFNFYTGQREPGESVAISEDQVIIVEGIHGMNPDLVPYIPPKKIFRIYVSALTQLNLDRHNRIPTTDTRLLRRIIRDANHRGYTATDTINRWPKVRRGEHQWIFPYQENADVMFNSALVYEVAVMKSIAEPLLRQVEPGTPAHIEAKRLLSFLDWFESCPADLVPANSILREFVGGSILRTYQAGLR